MTDRKGHPFGMHRVVEPKGALPQNAWKVDADFSGVYSNEILLDVDVLNIDSSSFRQMSEAAEQTGKDVVQIIVETVGERGKQHNPVTGSGGMLLGRVHSIGADVGERFAGLEVGDRVATLVSLSLTPLRIDEVHGVIPRAAQVQVSGQAVLFESGSLAILPDDFEDAVALAALDVCGAPSQVARMAHEGETVLVLGAGGKSGLLCVAEARLQVGARGRVIGVEPNAGPAAELRALKMCDCVLEVDAKTPALVYDQALAANGGAEFDLSISCVNVSGAEMSAILPVRQRGRVYFFSMATSFTAAALGAEGVSKDVDIFIGNGYAEGHAKYTLDLLRKSPELRALFTARYGSKTS